VSGAVRFGVFEFDPETGLLTREGTPVRLQPQPARVLAMLVARAGTVVTRESLRQHVWADGTFVDFEHSLNAAVKRLRATVAGGDQAKAQAMLVDTLAVVDATAGKKVIHRNAAARTKSRLSKAVASIK